MNLEFTEEQQLIKDSARKFAEENISPVARDNDINETFPKELIKKMADAGFLGAPVPEKYGGNNLDYISYAILTEEIGRACSSARTIISVQTSLVAMTILKWGTEEQKLKYLPKLCSGELIGCFGLTEPNAGSDAANQSTTASLNGKNWILNGAKTWISNGGIADIAIVFAQTDKTQDHKGIAAFLVEKSTTGFSTIKITGKLGLKASDTAQLIFKDCKIPKNSLMGQVGEGFTIAMSALDNGRYSVAAGCVGIAQACVDASLKYTNEREQFNRKISKFQMVQDIIARMIVDTEAARLLVYKAGHLKNKGQKSTAATSMAKYFASEAAMRISTDAIQLHGGYGYSNEYPVERYFRDAKVATIYEGTSQIQKLIIAREALEMQAIR